MSADPRQFEQFVAVLRRRLVVVRVLEAAGLGALVGSIIAGVLLPLLAWRAQPALAPALGAIGVGALVGFIWAVGRIPTALAAAAEADRQLGLADLLGTALGVLPRARESDADAGAAPWIETVLAAADAVCARHVPSQVILHRLNARAWGGIALAAALVVTVAALVSESPRAVAGGGAAPSPLAQGRVAQPEFSADERGVSAVRSPAPARPSRTDPATTERPLDTAAGSDAAEPSGPAAPGNAAAARRDAASNAGAGDGSSGGRQAATAQLPMPPRAADAPDSAAGPRRTPPGTGQTGGAGVASPAGSSGGDAAAPGVSATGDSPARTPPWHSDTWPADADRAADAINAGHVPAAHRDLVREYFERQ